MGEFSFSREEALQGVYFKYEITETVVRDVMYVKLSDLDKLTDIFRCLRHTFHGILSCDLLEDSVELFEENSILESGFYIRLDTKNTAIFKHDNKYYTIDKFDKYDIYEIRYMRSIEEIINEEKIYESLLNTFSSEEFIYALKRFAGDNDINITKFKSNPKINDSVQFFVNTNLEKTKAWSKLQQLANVAGYKIVNNEQSNGIWNVVFIPYHADSANDVVKENNNIVYHLTSKYFLNKALKQKFIPFRSEFGWEGKSKLYLFCGEINKKFEREICSFKNQSLMQLKYFHPKKLSDYYEKNVFVKIDLNKSKEQFNFYHDAAYKCSINPLYTKDSIPTECIVGFYNVLKTSLDNYEKI